ncbi:MULTISPECIES: hypothetical protein [Streptomyces]|uniref:Uncharacterized protein n=1 Tax=Streptomyces harbinensis TaxID=1176198 RepID=A0A1I6UU88_9ACTN|nr:MULTISPECIES: hypothetical protein [Streptomyces]QKV69240.1 hypothetical protein HUT13_10940 [Streptomyces harbinensis]SFT04966.1 hypothetical protein SAMN05444716_106192 [Streptomyces harbinensis]
MFGKGKESSADRGEEAPVLDWRDVSEFSFGRELRRVGKKRRKPVGGPYAVRVPTGDPQDPLLLPCAFFAPDVQGISASRLYEDAAAQHVLVSYDPREASGEEGVWRYRVRDGAGEEIGAIRRIPPANRMVKHTWRIDQPGRPEIVGRNKLARTRPGAAKWAVGRMIGEALASATAGDESDSARKPRTLEWTADGEAVMTSQYLGTYVLSADWLDRRLAFAYALLRDQ